MTGARPNEAAFLVLMKPFRSITGVTGCDFEAVIPAACTKTRRRYQWDLPREVSQAVRTTRALHRRMPSLDFLGNQHSFGKKLYDWFTRRLLPETAKT